MLGQTLLALQGTMLDGIIKYKYYCLSTPRDSTLRIHANNIFTCKHTCIEIIITVRMTVYYLGHKLFSSQHVFYHLAITKLWQQI